MRMDSTSKYSFAVNPTVKKPRSTFMRPHSHKTTMDSGLLVNIYHDEVLPGDTFDVNSTVFCRLNTPLVPIMDNMYIDIHWFYVPIRIIWENGKKFFGERVNPSDSIDYTIPQLNSGTGFTTHTHADYFGLPLGIADLDVNALPFRCLAKIYNDHYRDQNIIDIIDIEYGDSGDVLADMNNLRRRCKRHDYFTSCLPFPQKGPSVPLVDDDNAIIKSFATGGSAKIRQTSDGVIVDNVSDNLQNYYGDMAMANYGGVSVDPNGTLYADISLTINEFRERVSLQQFYEIEARAGSRYIEIIEAHYGVTNPDYRVQRAEYLGSQTAPLFVNPVVQNSESGTTPQGTLAGVGTGVLKCGFTKSFTEHGYVFGILSTRADLSYQQTLHKMWTRQTRLDFHFPVFDHLGEDTVLRKEIECTGASTDEDVFGYQERWAEYKYYPSLITGKFRSNDAQSLDPWHLAQDFGGVAPTLSKEFIEENPPLDRCIAVESEPQFKVDMFTMNKCTRVMSMYSTPGLERI